MCLIISSDLENCELILATNPKPQSQLNLSQIYYKISGCIYKYSFLFF